jgi:hypothetical protein
VVGPGIADALIATAVGLAAAIPAVVAYNHYLNRVRRMDGEMEGFVEELVQLFETYADVIPLMTAVRPNGEATTEAFEAAGVAGALRHDGGDFLAVVGNNGAQNKADYYTRRKVRYRVELQPDGVVAAGLGVRLANETPTEGLARHVIGPNLGPLEAGDNVTHLTVYCADCTLDGYDGPTPDLLEIDHELGYPAFGLPVLVPSGQAQDLTWSWTVEDGWDGGAAGGTYRLTVHNQPTIVPNHIRLEVVPPAGMEVMRTTPNMTVEGDGTAVFDAETRGPVAIEVKVAPPGMQRAWVQVWDFLRRPVVRVGASDQVEKPLNAPYPRSDYTTDTSKTSG